MKKMLVLALALVLVFSGAAMAEPPVIETSYTGSFADDPFNPNFSQEFVDGDYEFYVDNDFGGMVYYNDVDSTNPGKYTHLESLKRDVNAMYRDKNNGTNGQEVAIKLNAKAYIPCFLEMRLTGNQGTTSAISYGPNASGQTTATGYEMVFDNELGGYLDEDWQSLGYGSNVQLNPNATTYIGACDIFSVEVFSNDDYRYEVESQALAGQNGAQGETLPMHMRSDLGNGWLPNDYIFNASSIFDTNRSAGVKLTAVHNFKVPFSMSTVHGEYTGNVIFRALTI